MPNSQSDTARRDTLTSADAGVVASMLDLDRRARALERGVGGLLPRPRRVCMLSVHSCPLAAPGGKETGGMNVYVRELSRQLGRRGYLVDNYTRSESPDVPHILDTDLGPNVRVIHVVAGPESHMDKADAWRYAPEFVAGVKGLIAAEGLDYDLYHSHYWMSGWVARQLADRYPAPIVHMFHTLGVMKELARRDGTIGELAQRQKVERDIARFADTIVAGSGLDRDQIAQHYEADPGKLQVIPPGVDLDLFRPIPREVAVDFVGADPDARVVLFVGRPDPVKGLDTLVRAISIVVEREPSLRDNACLCIIGGDKTDDPRRTDAEQIRIDALRQELGLADFVKFLGAVPQGDLPYYYSLAEVLVVPSLYESFGMVALEAMACGTPVIASDVGGLSTLVRDGRTGFLVPDSDPEALAEKLLPLLRDPALRRTLGYHGIATAEAYGWPSIAERIERLYEATLAKAAAG
ncbi:MAG: glycosyltransferase [Anaerolineae bacterium]